MYPSESLEEVEAQPDKRAKTKDIKKPYWNFLAMVWKEICLEKCLMLPL